MATKKKNDLKELAAEYAKILAQELKLKTLKDEVQAMIKESMKKAGADKIETNVGSFTFYKRTTWEYSPEIQAAYEVLKIQEKDEQENGAAKPTVAETFRFTPLKVKAK